LRNNFLSKDIKFKINGEQHTAKWAHVKAMYELDSAKPIRAIPKWTYAHMTLPRSVKMKVDVACQVSSIDPI
jgi:hypothetical protein